MIAAAASMSGSAHRAPAGYGSAPFGTSAHECGTRKLLSGVMKSRFPEYPVAITGLPRSIDSAIVSPNPSLRCSDT